MKKKARFLSAAMAAVILTQVNSFGASEYFKDVTSKYDWAQEAIDSLYNDGVVSGFEDGYFRPADTIRRCDFLVMLYKKFGTEGNYVVKLAEDVERGVYYDDAYIWAANAGIVDSSELFYPTEAITRQDAFELLFKCLEDEGIITDDNKSSDVSGFSDSGEVDKDKIEAVGTLISLGIVSGSDGLILPDSTMTRAEMAVVFYKAGDISEEIEEEQSGIIVDGSVSVDVESVNAKYTVTTSVDTNYLVDGVEASLADESISVEDRGKSGIIITNGGSLDLSDSSISKSGDSASSVNTGTSGVNSAIIVRNGSTLNLDSSQISTSGRHSNGISVFDGGNTAIIKDCEITTTGDNSAAVLVVDNSVLSIINTAVKVKGTGVPAVSLNSSEGTYTIKDSTISAHGDGVQAVTTGGNLTISGSTLSSSDSVGLQSIGSTTVNIDDVTFDTAGAFIEITDTSQNASDHTTTNTTNITNCDLEMTSTDSPIIDVVNVHSDIYITGCNLISANMLFRSRIDKSSNAYAKGADTTVTLDNQDAEGNVVSGFNASVTVVLKNGSFMKTALNPNQSGNVNIKLTSSDDKLRLTGDCYVGYIDNHGDYSFSNISDNGCCIYYDPNLEESYWLDGDTYSLPNGGVVAPL